VYRLLDVGMELMVACFAPLRSFHIINGVMFADKYLPVTAFLVPLGLLPLIGEVRLLLHVLRCSSIHAHTSYLFPRRPLF
jgi:hypothetical protein